MLFFMRSRVLSDMLAVSLRRPPFVKSAGLDRFLSTVSHWEGGVSLVQGASRGIGLEFVRQLLEKNNKGHVVATCRNPDEANNLLELKGKFEDRLNILPLDVTDESTIEAMQYFSSIKISSLCSAFKIKVSATQFQKQLTP